MGRSPLTFAIENDFEDIVEVKIKIKWMMFKAILHWKLLLMKKANPNSSKFSDYKNIAKSYVVEKMITTARKVRNLFKRVYFFLWFNVPDTSLS